ncbi:type III pantothenate kinase, partial [candidate division KSB1 bacterium]
MNILAIDIGNTNTALGYFENRNLRYSWRFSTRIDRTSDELGILIHSFLQSKGLTFDSIDGSIISSVVPYLTSVFSEMVNQYCNVQSILVDSSINLGIKILYENPKEVGADRLCNAVGSIEKYGGPAIIIDFGTATTFDIVSENREYIGGVIAPGIETASLFLHKLAAKLPRVELKFPENIIGKNTEASIQSGIMNGTVVMIDGMVNLLKKEFDSKAKVIATGGLANLIKERSKEINIIDPYLTLTGLIHIF